jgi:16S rRNA (cytidine1402-2'-O)-methyltransferase
MLYLLPVWLGEHGDQEDMPVINSAIAASITLYFAEHEKTARHMLRRLVPGIDLGALEIIRVDKGTTATEAEQAVRLMANGRNAAVISEAGMPGIADPGALLVRAAHATGIKVIPLTGPSSLLLALAASGLNGQEFTFHGYLPRDRTERQQRIRDLDQRVQRTGSTQLFIETPYRNDALLADLLKTCAPTTLLCIACDLTQPSEMVRTMSIAQWKKAVPELKDRPTVFLLGR